MWISGNRYLSLEEQQNNALLIRDYFEGNGWTVNAIAGMLGNMETESTINPGIWQGLEVNFSRGFGLVQWTPATKYTNWAGAGYESGDLQCDRIMWELENNEQYVPSVSYPLSFYEFSVSTLSPYNLGMAFLLNYERPLNQNQPNRGRQAEYWYEFLTGNPPQPPDPDPIIPKKMKLIYYMRKF